MNVLTGIILRDEGSRLFSGSCRIIMTMAKGKAEKL